MRYYVELDTPSDFREDGAFGLRMEESSIDWQIVVEKGPAGGNPIVCFSHESYHDLKNFVRDEFFAGMSIFDLMVPWQHVYSDELPFEMLKSMREGFLPWVASKGDETYEAHSPQECAGAQYVRQFFPNALYGSATFCLDGQSIGNMESYSLLKYANGDVMTAPYTFSALHARLLESKATEF